MKEKTPSPKKPSPPEKLRKMMLKTARMLLIPFMLSAQALPNEASADNLGFASGTLKESPQFGNEPFPSQETVSGMLHEMIKLAKKHEQREIIAISVCDDNAKCVSASQAGFARTINRTTERSTMNMGKARTEGKIGGGLIPEIMHAFNAHTHGRGVFEESVVVSAFKHVWDGFRVGKDSIISGPSLKDCSNHLSLSSAETTKSGDQIKKDILFIVDEGGVWVCAESNLTARGMRKLPAMSDYQRTRAELVTYSSTGESQEKVNKSISTLIGHARKLGIRMRFVQTDKLSDEEVWGAIKSIKSERLPRGKGLLD